MRKIVAIIPARMASTRFPGKPLAKILGLPMVEHVRRRVLLCKELSDVFVATCDKEIKDTIENLGGKVIMTKGSHKRCTDRIAEAARLLDADVIVNVQGDEPLILPQMISHVVEPLLADNKCKCVNLICPILTEEDFKNPNAVKTVLDEKGNVLYFSREPIPSPKKTMEPFKKYKQLGIIAFDRDLLLLYSAMKETPLERIESVDMLRLTENGYPIKAVITDKPLYGVDTPEELKRVEAIMKKDKLVKRYI